MSWRELGLRDSDCQDKLRDNSVCKVPFAGCARHPSSLADTASKERSTRTSTVEGFLSWGAGDSGCRVVFNCGSGHDPLPSSKRSTGGFGIIHLVSPSLGLSMLRQGWFGSCVCISSWITCKWGAIHLRLVLQRVQNTRN